MVRSIFVSLLVIPCLMPSHAQAPTSNHEVVRDVAEAAAVIIEACLDQSEGHGDKRERCIGITIQECTLNAVTTVDMLGCLQPEIDAWDARLESTFEQLRAKYVEQDTHEDPIRALAPRLELVQEQWRVWRGAKCGFAYDMFRGGSLGRITGADCQLEETAQRALELDDLLADAQ